MQKDSSPSLEQLLQQGAVGVAIRKAREALGLTQGDVAKKLHVSRVFMSLVESGRKRLSDEVRLRVLGKALKLDDASIQQLIENTRAEWASKVARQLERITQSREEVVPGVSLASLRVLLQQDAAKAAEVKRWLGEMPHPRLRISDQAKSGATGES